MKKEPGHSITPLHHHQKTSQSPPVSNETSVTGSIVESPEHGFHKLFYNQLKDIYWTELALSAFLPAMINQADSQDLRDQLSALLSVTEQHVSRCEEIFAALHCPVEASTCQAIQDLIDEAKASMENTHNRPEHDAAIIHASNKILHYQIAVYSSLATWARQLQNEEVAGMLEETCYEEKETVDALSELANKVISASLRTGIPGKK